MTREELILKAKEAKSAEELIVLAKENGFELTEEDAKIYFDQLSPKSGELSDDELDNVAGGGCPDGYTVTTVADKCYAFECKKCGYKPRGTTYGVQKCRECGTLVVCNNCKHCEYKNALWLCSKEM